ncbi:MAG TPA: adenosylcobinamide-GDP ribazoletransferase [Ktedonobacteraceae bacterium]|nr:adenosylcobinamide-GDP ribazoletransferase [Ktedonobacteraceae bacterium]
MKRTWSELRETGLRQYKKLLMAAGFLSILPLPGSRRLFKANVVEASPLSGGEYFPLVGALLALLLAGALLLLAPLFPQPVLAALLVVGLVVLTGGLHLDGLMDTCDGLFGGLTRERKLEIMRDSRVGSFGVLAGICALLLKFACFASLGKHGLPAVLLVTLPSARWTLVLALRLFPGARASGLGATFRQDITPRTLALAGVLTLALVLLGAQFAGLLVWGAMTLTALALGAWITRQLGGLTGDTYGAIAESAEIVGLLTFLLLHF